MRADGFDVFISYSRADWREAADIEKLLSAASLKTFFVGQCLLQYANVARAWMKEHEDAPALLRERELAVAEPVRFETATEDVLRDLVELARANGCPNDRSARVVALDALGYRREEIASEMDITGDAVASVLKRERARLRQNMADTRKGEPA